MMKSKASRGQTRIRVNRMVCSTVCSSSSQRWKAVHLVFELEVDNSIYLPTFLLSSRNSWNKDSRKCRVFSSGRRKLNDPTINQWRSRCNWWNSFLCRHLSQNPYNHALNVIETYFTVSALFFQDVLAKRAYDFFSKSERMEKWSKTYIYIVLLGYLPSSQNSTRGCSLDCSSVS